MDVGERWVYQPSKFDAIHCAEILNIGKTVKVKIHESWLKGKYKVPRNDLHVPWADRAEYAAKMKPFMDLSDMDGPSEEEWDAAELVLVATGLSEDINFHIYGCAETYNAPLVARACRVSIETVTAGPGTVVDGSYAAIPWETVLKLVKRLAWTRFEAILDYIRDYDKVMDQLARDKSTTDWSGLDEVEYARLKSYYDDMLRPGNDLVRQWCGARRSKQSDELVQLRADYAQLLKLALAAAENLRPSTSNSQLAGQIKSIAHQSPTNRPHSGNRNAPNVTQTPRNSAGVR